MPSLPQKALGGNKSTLWSVADQSIVSGASFLTNIIAARLLGIDDFGFFALIWLIVLFCQSLQTAIISTPLIVIGSSPKDQLPERYYESMAAIQILFAITASLTVFTAIIVAHIGTESFYLALITATLVFSSQILDFLRKYYYTVQNYKSPLFQDFIRYALQLIFIYWIYIALPRSSNDLIIVLFLCAAAPLITAIPFIRHLPNPALSRGHLVSTFKRNYHFSKWQLGSAILQWLTGNFIVIASATSLGVSAAGALRAGQAVLGLTNVFFQAAENIVPQRAARAWRDLGAHGLFNFTAKLTAAAIGLTAALCLALSLGSEFIITGLFGQDYAGYGFVIVGYSVIYLIMAALVPMRYASMAMENTRLIFIAYAAGAITALSTGQYFVANFGIVGALTAMALSQFALGATLLVGNYITFAAKR